MAGLSKADLNQLIAGMLASIVAVCGERTSAVVMISFPIEGGHDRFMTNATGPCMSTLGLLEWAGKALGDEIREKWIKEFNKETT